MKLQSIFSCALALPVLSFTAACVEDPVPAAAYGTFQMIDTLPTPEPKAQCVAEGTCVAVDRITELSLRLRAVYAVTEDGARQVIWASNECVTLEPGANDQEKKLAPPPDLAACGLDLSRATDENAVATAQPSFVSLRDAEAFAVRQRFEMSPGTYTAVLIEFRSNAASDETVTLEGASVPLVSLEGPREVLPETVATNVRWQTSSMASAAELRSADVWRIAFNGPVDVSLGDTLRVLVRYELSGALRTAASVGGSDESSCMKEAMGEPAERLCFSLSFGQVPTVSVLRRNGAIHVF